MNGLRWAGLLILLAYAGSGFYTIAGNEQGVIRRCGRVVLNPAGEPVLKNSGLHYDLPWPFSTVDRINLNEVRTLTLGGGELAESDGEELLQSISGSRQAQFLTGDKNILNVQISVQYRISERGVLDFLFRSESAERHLRWLVEAAAADLISCSGVDYVHPLGLGELRELLTREVRDSVRQYALGVEVDEVSISAVSPPLRVKADFLDVSNARADKEKYINAASAYAEQRLADAQAEARQVLDEAEIDRRELVEQARGAADSFMKLVAQFRRHEEQGIQTYAAARRMALERRYRETMEHILRAAAGKVFLEGDRSVDLTIFRESVE